MMVKIYNAADAIEAERVVAELKECGIPSYYQDSSSSVVGYGVTGFGLYGVDVYVDDSDREKAKSMDIYAKAKYNRPAELSEVVNGALKPHSDSDES